MKGSSAGPIGSSPLSSPFSMRDTNPFGDEDVELNFDDLNKRIKIDVLDEDLGF